jgi:hypothetical protein
VASSYSKSTLVSVCGVLREAFKDVDYFPAYEIITSQNARGAYYEANKRSVSPQGVRTAMEVFLRSNGFAPAASDAAPTRMTRPSMPRLHQEAADDVICEEALLDAFAR